ncbi:unnamed protein product [Acanthosepion pharaonis]|uniref:Uncharacterized protein n=1 Tax=Acanthosepion pharaonis TaxID=158019 RepID=A0A812C7N7_ACAPH|nr:unnamed protein product [Sepia pharaonis]
MSTYLSIYFSKTLEKRIPVSWEDQLSNFPEEVKIIKRKDSPDNEQPQNCCENYRILSRTPTSKLIWRQMTRPYSDSLSGLTTTEYINSSLEQPLPTSASFIKGTKLKNDLMNRYVLHGEKSQRTLTGTKKPKMQQEMSRTRGERPKATKNEVVSLQICKLKAPSIFTLSTEQLKTYETKAVEHDVQDQMLSKKTRPKKKDKIPILPLAHPKPFPRDPKIMEEYFHITKMDTWLPYSSDENRTRKSHEIFENLAVHVNNHDRNNSAEYKNYSTSEKENNTVNNAMHTDNLEIHAITLAKPPNFKGSEVKVTTREVQRKATSVKNLPVIHFKIPYCGYWNECEMPNSEEDHQVTESNNQEKLKSSAESSTRKKIPDGRDQKTTKFHYERPKTR